MSGNIKALGESEGSNNSVVGKRAPRVNTLLGASAIAAASIVGSTAPAQADSISDLRTAGDWGQVIGPAIAGYCAYEKGALGNYGTEFATSVGLSYVGKAIFGNEGIGERPRGGSTPGFPSSHTAAAASGFAGALKYCDNPWLQVAAGANAVMTGYSRMAGENAPHTELQVGVGFALPFIAEYTGINDVVTQGVADLLQIDESAVQFQLGGDFSTDNYDLFNLSIKF